MAIALVGFCWFILNIVSSKSNSFKFAGYAMIVMVIGTAFSIVGVLTGALSILSRFNLLS